MPAATLDALVGDDILRRSYRRRHRAGLVVATEFVPTKPPVVAVITWVMLGVVLVVNVTVAKPLAEVVLVGGTNEPPFVLLHVTT